MRLRYKKLFVAVFLLLYLNVNMLSAQDATTINDSSKKPVMYSVFWNTLWGSAWGATMGFSYHLISGIKLRESIISATTIGGVLGYGLGIYLVINGLSFDESYLLELPSPKFKNEQTNINILEDEMVPLYSRSKNINSNEWELPIFVFQF